MMDKRILEYHDGSIPDPRDNHRANAEIVPGKKQNHVEGLV